MFRFGNPYILYILFIIPVLIILLIFLHYKKKHSLKKFGNLNVIRQLMPSVSYGRMRLKLFFALFALTAMIVALADPQFGSKLENVKRKGVEIIIALDVSNSMLAEDIQPNRITNAKRAISKLVNNLKNDKIGLIVFAGDAYTQVPITTDYGAVKMFLSSVNTKIVPKQGTAIGTAIDLGIKSFSPTSELDKAIIIITDGENHDDNAVEAAELAQKKGITVHTIGMGSTRGAPIPISENYGQKIFKKDNDGNVVITKLNKTMLQDISEAGNGVSILANNTQTGLNTIFHEISKMNKKDIETKIYTDYEHQFQILVGFALFFILMEFIILNKKNKKIKNFNL
ncbi:MAG: VWA domain-containing protein, partial [Bacteroidales bacterium]|nr:VWA domain-containing protein [Bacteroidales bacterium]